MKEIVSRLQEQRQIEVAKELLESRGYKVSKNSRQLKESATAVSQIAEKLKSAGAPTLADYTGDSVGEDEATALSQMAKALGASASDIYIIYDEAEPELLNLYDEAYEFAKDAEELQVINTIPGEPITICEKDGVKFALRYSYGSETYFFPLVGRSFESRRRVKESKSRRSRR